MQVSAQPQKRLHHPITQHHQEETRQEKSHCCVCGKPATRLICSINNEAQVSAILMCDTCVLIGAREEVRRVTG
jgi:hypothetical protein